jgi:menaquinone-dependent protoporphyrinogen oxidase
VSKIYIVYGTTEGQTARIADMMAEVIRAHGHEVAAVDVKQARDGPAAGYDGVIVGASIHMGKHDKHAVEFVQHNREMLERVPSGFFSVSLAAHGDVDEAEGYLEQFQQETGWRPAKVALFGGALLYTRYGFFKRRLMKKIAGDKPGHLGTDTSRDYVYTEWDAVRGFAEDFLSQPSTATASEEAGQAPG